MHSGDLITLGILDIDGVRMFFATGFVRLILLSVLIGVGAYLLISTDLLLGLLSLSFVPFVGWRSSVVQLKLRATWLELQDRLTVMSRVMDENLGGIRVVRAFAAQEHELAKFDQASLDALELAHERVNLRVTSTSLMNLSFFLSMGLVLWLGGYKVMNGEITVGTLATFLTFMTILQMPVRQLGLLVNSFARASTCGIRLFALLDLELAVKDKPAAPEIKITEGTLKFDHVSFRYPGTTRDVLKDISFTARRGETIAMVGPPGSGKSTLVHLIAGLDRPTAGTVRVAGTALGELAEGALSAWRGRHVGVVFQFFQLLPTLTVLENVLLPIDLCGTLAPARARTRARALLDQVGIADQADKLPNALSGGQQQRAAIARALANDPEVVLADEPTGNLDSATADAVLELLRGLARAGKTIVVVTHDRDIASRADRMVTLVDGRVAEVRARG